MDTSLVLLALFSVAFARPGDLAVFSSDTELKNLTEDGLKQVLWIKTALEKTPGEYDELIVDRFECLMWQCKVQAELVNKTASESIFKGMLKNKQVNNFQCIGNAEAEALDKLKTLCEKIPEDTETLKKKSFAVLAPNGLLLDGFLGYVNDLYKKKSEELEKAKTDNDKAKIVAEVKQKVQHLKSISEQIYTQIKNIKNTFFSDYIVYAYKTEETLKKAQREGSQKVQKCISPIISSESSAEI